MGETFNVANPSKENIEYAIKQLLFFCYSINKRI